MSDTSIGIIWNPSKTDAALLRDAVDKTFGNAAEGIRWWETSVDDPGTGMAQEAVEAGCGTVVAVGGDGTVRAVAEALAGTGVSLGIVPRGTGNLLARNLAVPLDDLAGALARIAADESTAIDLGWVSLDDGPEHAFAVMVGFGIDAQMLSETDDDLKDRAGWLAYVEAMGRAMAGTEMTDIVLEIDGDEPQDVRGHTMIIGNCGMIQGGLRLLPDARLDDGMLDLLLVSSDGALQWLETVRSVVWDNGILRRLTGGDKAVSTESTRHLTAESLRVQLASPLTFEIDGEELGDVSTIAVRVQAAALQVL
ncbi:diacylglycerol/lipid kinase family protein [uncultured Microbacterium sp.]|uniref:diacylglycerol/lipid kinase family protein n=1 Tax=uncultured Microbacterium sp. TaxID=191216 RepID=UPI002632101B|nr:diacylglycerol kinase family protein [uncultured Microbacterium sp.]